MSQRQANCSAGAVGPTWSCWKAHTTTCRFHGNSSLGFVRCLDTSQFLCRCTHTVACGWSRAQPGCLRGWRIVQLGLRGSGPAGARCPQRDGLAAAPGRGPASHGELPGGHPCRFSSCRPYALRCSPAVGSHSPRICTHCSHMNAASHMQSLGTLRQVHCNPVSIMPSCPNPMKFQQVQPLKDSRRRSLVPCVYLMLFTSA